MQSSFNPKIQETDLTSKIVVGIERLSEVLRVLLWEKSKETGLSPIQIQILIFIQHHDSSLANVSHLSAEFNLKKPTISDAIKVLFEKKLIEKEIGEDARGYTILLSSSGKKMVETLKGFESPLRDSIDKVDKHTLEELYAGMSRIIFSLNQAGIIHIQRTCFGCAFYAKKGTGHYCQYIKKDLSNTQIRLDCDDFKLANA